jgi:hypothetical protein
MEHLSFTPKNTAAPAAKKGIPRLKCKVLLNSKEL